MFYHLHFITSCLISSPLLLRVLTQAYTVDAKLMHTNIYSVYTSNRLLFVNSSLDSSIMNLHLNEVLTCPPSCVFILYMGDRPWMLCLTGPAAVKCV